MQIYQVTDNFKTSFLSTPWKHIGKWRYGSLIPILDSGVVWLYLFVWSRGALMNKTALPRSILFRPRLVRLSHQYLHVVWQNSHYLLAARSDMRIVNRTAAKYSCCWDRNYIKCNGPEWKHTKTEKNNPQFGWCGECGLQGASQNDEDECRIVRFHMKMAGSLRGSPPSGHG